MKNPLEFILDDADGTLTSTQEDMLPLLQKQLAAFIQNSSLWNEGEPFTVQSVRIDGTSENIEITFAGNIQDNTPAWGTITETPDRKFWYFRPSLAKPEHDPELGRRLLSPSDDALAIMLFSRFKGSEFGLIVR